MSGDTPAEGRQATDDRPAAQPPTIVEELSTDLDEIGDRTEAPAIDDEIATLKQLLATAHERELIDSGLRQLGFDDVAETVVGSVVFAVPLLVEDGVFDIAAHLTGTTVGGVPVFLIANTLFTVLIAYALLEWTGKDTRELRQLFGVVPVRVVMVLGVSLVVATTLMILWGRLGDVQSTMAALARIDVLWTVSALGGALGDIVSGDDPPPVTDRQPGAVDGASDGPNRARAGDRPATPPDHPSDAALLGAIHTRFERLNTLVAEHDMRREVGRLRERTETATVGAGPDDAVHKYTVRDVAEAFVGSILFSIPFLVEDGVFDVAAYLLSVRVGGVPIYLVANVAVVVLLVMTVVYWAGPQTVQMSRPLFGVVPRRLVGVTVVSALTVAGLMLLWGRIDLAVGPADALARINVVWTIAAVGAALGDILPGESSGDDLNDDLAAIPTLLEELVE